MHRVVSLCRPHWSGYTMVNTSSYIATDPTDHERWQAPAKGLYVGMVSDGKNRDGYAHNVCEVLRSHRAQAGVTVRIIDAATIRQGVSNWQRMGQARC